MSVHQQIESALGRQGFSDYRWLDPSAIQVAEWVRLKCEFGCPHYGRAAVCPPNTPEIDISRRFFAEYREALIFHFQVAETEPEARHAWSTRTNRALVGLERDAFLAGCPKAFALFTDACHLCQECVPQRNACLQPALARPPATAMGVDVFSTARSAGYSVEVLKDLSAPADFFAFLMLD